MRALGNKSITGDQIDEVRNIVVQSGALDYCRNLVKQLSEQAKSHISDSDFRQEGKSFLLAIADYMTQREK